MADLLMPKFGLTMTEGLLSEWHVAPGEAFAAGQLLYTVETEKVANEVDAEAAGTLADILVQAGETVAVGTPVARLAGREGAPEAPRDVRDAPSARKLMADHGVARAEVAASGRDGRVLKEDVLRVIATPLARRIAQQQGVDLKGVQGSGSNARIKADDVRRRAEAAPTRGPRQTVPDAARLATARRVTASKRDIPHFYVTHEAEIGALSALRSQLNAEAGQGGRAKISVTHMLIKALGLALAEMPGLNRIWAGDAIHAFDRVDVGMVAETPQGLRVPVLRNAGAVALDDLAARAGALAERARGGSLLPDDVGDSVVSISNVGMIGVSTLTPIINPPNAMILGVGAERALFRPGPNGAPVARRELVLTLAADHRIVDGAEAARFLASLVALLEEPVRLLRPPRRGGGDGDAI
jgi:pyruvate dehydrogenase E2 component (dihydrolipoamide acetyltransferase)